MLKKFILRFKRALQFRKFKRTPEWAAFESASAERALERIAKRGMRIATVIDVGASNGSWSDICMRHFPLSEYLLVEAQSCHVQDLQNFCSKHPNASYLPAAAGNEDGFCFFDDSDAFGGLASNDATNGCKTKLPMVRLDTVVAEKGLKGPFLLKLDTHGFELQIIQGSETLLQQAELAVIETYIFRLNDKALIFHELCMEMDKRGFQVVDFSEPMWRPGDKALWQWDFFFVKKTNPVFRDNSYT